VLVLTPHNEIHRERDLWRRYFSSRVYDLTVYSSKEEKEAGADGEVVRVIPRDVHLHPIKNNVYCVNYLRYYPGRPIDIPIKYVNEEESPVLKRGGFIVPIHRQLKCIIDDGVPIPEYLELDCTGAKTKEKLGLNRIAIPDGVQLVKNINTTTWFHGSVFGK
jgi:large subunit ribosomal protein L25